MKIDLNFAETENLSRLSTKTLAPRQVGFPHKSKDLSNRILEMFKSKFSCMTDTEVIDTNTNMSKKGNASDDSQTEGKDDDGQGGLTDHTAPSSSKIKSDKVKKELFDSEEIIDVDNMYEEVAVGLTEENKLKLKFLQMVAANNQKTITNSHTLLAREGLAAETPSSLIPVFSGKAFVWAERIENILKARGIINFRDITVTQWFLPVVSKLSPDIARDAPSLDLHELLEYLKGIHRIKYDLGHCFIEGRKL